MLLFKAFSKNHSYIIDSYCTFYDAQRLVHEYCTLTRSSIYFTLAKWVKICRKYLQFCFLIPLILAHTSTIIKCCNNNFQITWWIHEYRGERIIWFSLSDNSLSVQKIIISPVQVNNYTNKHCFKYEDKFRVLIKQLKIALKFLFRGFILE